MRKDPLIADLENLLDAVFAMPKVASKSTKELADLSGLSISTIRNLENRKIGAHTHFRTIQKITSVVGMAI